MTLSPAQCRAARALLNWSQVDLVRASGITKKTIADFERGANHPAPGNTGADPRRLRQGRGRVLGRKPARSASQKWTQGGGRSISRFVEEVTLIRGPSANRRYPTDLQPL